MSRLLTHMVSLLALVFLSVGVPGQTLTPVDSASSITFKIKNLGFNTTGHFSGITGTITFLPEDLAGSRFDVQVRANTVDTEVKMRDNHLRSEDYFDVKKFPQITFVSVKVTPSTKSGTLFVFGKLTLKGVTKDISFPFKVQPIQDGYLFDGEFKLNRRDFKVGGGNTVSDNLTVILKVVAKKA